MAQEQSTRPRVAARRRGGQPGNRNARKHGYYSDALDEQQRDALAAMPPPANDLEAALRLERLKAASVLKNDPLNLRVIGAAGKRLLKLEAGCQLLIRLSRDRRFRKKYVDAFARYGIRVTLPPVEGMVPVTSETGANVQAHPRKPMNESQARSTSGRSSAGLPAVSKMLRKMSFSQASDHHFRA